MAKDDQHALREFAELQERVLTQTDIAGRLAQQERMAVVQKQRSALTMQELQGMPDETPMFKGIGRAYFSSPKTDVVKELEGKVAQYESDVKKLKDQREALEVKMKDTETEIRELISSSPLLARRLGAIKL